VGNTSSRRMPTRDSTVLWPAQPNITGVKTVVLFSKPRMAFRNTTAAGNAPKACKIKI